MSDPEEFSYAGQPDKGSSPGKESAPVEGTETNQGQGSAPAVDLVPPTGQAWLSGDLLDPIASAFLLDTISADVQGKDASEALGELLGFFNSAQRAAVGELDKAGPAANTRLETSLSGFRAAVEALPTVHLYAEKSAIEAGTGGGAVGPSPTGQGVSKISALAHELLAGVLSEILNNSDLGSPDLHAENDGGTWHAEPIVRDTTSVVKQDDGLSASSLGKLGTIPMEPYAGAVSRGAAASGEIGSGVGNQARSSPAATDAHEAARDFDPLPAPVAVGESQRDSGEHAGADTPAVLHPEEPLTPNPPATGPVEVVVPESQPEVADAGSDPRIQDGPPAKGDGDNGDNHAEEPIGADENHGPDRTGEIHSGDQAGEHQLPGSSEHAGAETPAVIYPAAEAGITYGEPGHGPPADLVPLALEFLRANTTVDLATFVTEEPAVHHGEGSEHPAPDEHHPGDVRNELAEDPAPQSFDHDAHDPRTYDHDPGPLQDHSIHGLDHS